MRKIIHGAWGGFQSRGYLRQSVGYDKTIKVASIHNA